MDSWASRACRRTTSGAILAFAVLVFPDGLLAARLPLLTEKQHERKRTDDICSGVYFVSRLSQSCASQLLSVSRCKKEVCNMHAHALRKGTGAYGHFCPSPLQIVPSVYPTPCGHRQRDWVLPQARARSSYHAQRNLSPPRTEVAPSLSPMTQYWKTLRIC